MKTYNMFNDKSGELNYIFCYSDVLKDIRIFVKNQEIFYDHFNTISLFDKERNVGGFEFAFYDIFGHYPHPRLNIYKFDISDDLIKAIEKRKMQESEDDIKMAITK